MPMAEKFRLLMINDNPVTVEMMRNIVRRHRLLQSDAAVMAQDALEKIKDNPPYHVIITDLTTPYFTTLDVLRASKAKSPDTKVIMLASFGAQQAVIDAIKMGVYTYIHKPFRPDELNLALANATEHFLQRQRVTQAEQLAQSLRKELQLRDKTIEELEAQAAALSVELAELKPSEEEDNARNLDAAIEEAAAKKAGSPGGYRLYRELTDLNHMLEDQKISQEEFQEIRKSILDKTYKIPIAQV